MSFFIPSMSEEMSLLPEKAGGEEVQVRVELFVEVEVVQLRKGIGCCFDRLASGVLRVPYSSCCIRIPGSRRVLPPGTPSRGSPKPEDDGKDKERRRRQNAPRIGSPIARQAVTSPPSDVTQKGSSSTSVSDAVPFPIRWISLTSFEPGKTDAEVVSLPVDGQVRRVLSGPVGVDREGRRTGRRSRSPRSHASPGRSGRSGNPPSAPVPPVPTYTLRTMERVVASNTLRYGEYLCRT